MSASLRRFGRSLARLARTRYPAFLFGGTLAGGEIPVFAYHDVDAGAFESDLRFLGANGYRTIGIDEFHERRGHSGEKLVMLTFDDARRSFAEIARPRLAARGMRAVLFVPTHWIDDPQRRFMTWTEVRACERSDGIDVECHAHRHALVYTSARLAQFASPATLAHQDLFDWPMRRELGRDESGRPPLGTPIYEAAPLLSAPRRLIESTEATAACRALVEREGGAAFFEHADWRPRLAAVHAAAERRSPARFVPRAALERLVDRELDTAGTIFERELGRRPRYFAYPWMLGSAASLERLAARGYAAAFGVAIDFRDARRRRLPLSCYGRFKADWLRFLPGRGRDHLRDVLPRKLAAFTASQHLAH